jgi:hypothetical protein
MTAKDQEVRTLEANLEHASLRLPEMNKDVVSA